MRTCFSLQTFSINDKNFGFVLAELQEVVGHPIIHAYDEFSQLFNNT